MKRKSKILICDFETTVYDNQESTEVWASACVELYTENVLIFTSISDTFTYFKSLNTNLICYYHNLKFDGAFWLAYLIQDLHLKQAFVPANEEETEGVFQSNHDMPNNSFKYTISDMGQWYTITIKINKHIIEIRDSLKLLPFSVKRIGDSFKTKHRKLDMEYKGYRYAGCEITLEEREYIANDVLVVKEALEIMYNEGHNKLTIGSCCLEEYRHSLVAYDYKELFFDLTEFEIDSSLYTYATADAYVRKSYKGGWCYIVKEKANQLKHNGTTADVNSLYPSVMHSMSGNKYPIGLPHFWQGNIPEEAIGENKYYFVRVKTRFYLKEGYLPFIQIKDRYIYKGTEALESSDYYDPKTNKYYTHYIDKYTKQKHDTRVTLTLTMTDYELFKKHYELVDFEVLDGCWFYSMIGIFDEYINHYKEIKMNSKGALRELAKLFLNNLYGKMASNTDSSFKLAYEKENGSIGFKSIPANDKKAGYIPVGSAITSYARCFTITAAQKNYYGKDKSGFIYADTDSIHCDLQPNEIKGITVHDSEFCCWKLEAQWDIGIFTRQKTYIEHVTHENLIPIEEPYYNVKCAGMPTKCKDLFVKSMTDISEEELANYTPEEQQFLQTKRSLNDFKIGLKVPGKLMPKRIKGGIILAETTYEMR